jgi:hypothetical protein
MLIVKYSAMDELRLRRSVDILRYKGDVKIIIDTKKCECIIRL